MNQEITPEQKAQLDTWAGQRDSLLSEISGLQTQKEQLEKAVKESAESYSDIETMASQTIGRISELNRKEKELYLLTPKEVVDLRVEKSTLQSEISCLTKEIAMLNVTKDSLLNDISSTRETLKVMNDRIASMDKVIGDTTEINSNNVRVIEGLVTTAVEGLNYVIRVTNEATEKTNLVISELPKVFLEVQRQSLDRKIIKKTKI